MIKTRRVANASSYAIKTEVFVDKKAEVPTSIACTYYSEIVNFSSA